MLFLARFRWDHHEGANLHEGTAQGSEQGFAVQVSARRGRPAPLRILCHSAPFQGMYSALAFVQRDSLQRLMPTMKSSRDRGWDLTECGWHLAECGWDLAECGWHLAECGWHVAECGWMTCSRVWMTCSRVWMTCSRVWMTSSRVWMRSSREVRASDFQCQSRNSPGFEPSILWHSGIWWAADEAVLNKVK